MKNIKKNRTNHCKNYGRAKKILMRQMDEEQCSLTTIMNIALEEKYPEYKEITKGKGDKLWQVSKKR